MAETTAAEGRQLESSVAGASENQVLHCDRCGAPMIASHCKLVCLNCGGRLDCSDLSIYMDQAANAGGNQQS
jgi:uncharacterized Zn finger protein (UPF0148 family)